MPSKDKKVKKDFKVTMPDGQLILINKEKHEIVESLIKEHEFHNLPIKCLKQCDPELRS